MIDQRLRFYKIELPVEPSDHVVAELAVADLGVAELEVAELALVAD